MSSNEQSALDHARTLQGELYVYLKGAAGSGNDFYAQAFANLAARADELVTLLDSPVETTGRQNAQRINDNGAREIERLDKKLEKELENRDRNADYADQLTNMVGVLLGQDMGEHTSENEPWENAIEALRVAIGSKQSSEEPAEARDASIGARIPYDIGLRDDGSHGECGTNSPPEKDPASPPPCVFRTGCQHPDACIQAAQCESDFAKNLRKAASESASNVQHEPVAYDPAKTPEENVQAALDAPIVSENAATPPCIYRTGCQKEEVCKTEGVCMADLAQQLRAQSGGGIR